ncbi:GAF domain-containing sensor histidine kinase [Reinekea marinisedimentorum]|uniref:GAF domain-containing sensor histidine kinase n=1 Tax=Reinekea marinisedimentorum TaxID=230495 RepID=UPI00104ADC42|nr:ATP-binding protein [Reinekea marinisedimentorum]
MTLNDETQTASVLDAHGEPGALLGETLSFSDASQLLSVAEKTGYFVFKGLRFSVKPLLSKAGASCYLVFQESDIDYEKTRSLTRALEVLRNISQDLDQCKTLDEIYYCSVNGVLHYLDFDRAAIFLLNPDGESIVGTWGTDCNGAIRDEHSLVERLQDSPWYQGAVNAAGKVYVQQNASLFENHEVVGHGWHAVAAIRYSEDTVGWLVADNLIHSRHFSPNDQTLMLLFSQTIGQWIARFKAEQNLKELNESLEQKVEQKTSELQDIIHSLATTRENLVSTEKARTLANFTAGIAHEINNPIGFIRSNLSFIGKVSGKVVESVSQLDSALVGHSIEHLKEVEEVIEESVQGLDRVTHIISLLQPLNNLSDEQHQSFDVIQSIDFIILSLEKNADCISVMQPENPITVELPMQVFTLALENVLTNALEAVQDNPGPAITVRVIEQDDHIAVEVTDNGIGISAANLNSIFDPFFTTKAVGDGVGLGLSLSENLVKMINGSIKVTSTEGKGTSMTLVFPRGIKLNG